MINLHSFPLVVVPFLLLIHINAFVNKETGRSGLARGNSAIFSSNPLTADPYLAQKLVSQGMDAFRRGNVAESIQYFDQAEVTRPSITPFLWQRGLSYYYEDRFADASRQFRNDVKVNPLDVEEIVWDIASQYRLDPTKEPQMMSLPRGQADRRKIMVRTWCLHGQTLQLFI